MCSIAIKIDSSGPIFFRQERVGLNGRLFKIFKFRTMRFEKEPSAQLITVGMDPRITQSGKILRYWKLDELPQLLNVLKGEMSVVGPRPEVPYYVSLYPEHLRVVVLSVRPGITDKSSILLRDESTILAEEANTDRFYIDVLLPEKLKIASEYVVQRSFVGDIAIIGQTILAIAFPSKQKKTIILPPL